MEGIAEVAAAHVQVHVPHDSHVSRRTGSVRGGEPEGNAYDGGADADATGGGGGGGGGGATSGGGGGGGGGGNGSNMHTQTATTATATAIPPRSAELQQALVRSLALQQAVAQRREKLAKGTAVRWKPT